MKKGIILLGLFAIFTANAQELRPVCGNSAADQFMTMDRLIQNLETVESNQLADRGGIQYVPVFFHLVADGNGMGRVRELRVMEQLCAMNAAFESMGIQFYMSPHPTWGLFDKSINNDNVYTNQNNTFLMNAKKHPNAINYFITNLAASGNNDPGLTLAYYTPVNDWIVSRRDQINGNANNSTIPHETGHFFSLMHPFLGWEGSNGFGPSFPGWPIAPVIAPDGGPTEKQDGSNCTVAADRICDTGPDYKFAFQQGNCAPYNGGAKDPMGVLVDPMENNTMSYFDGCPTYEFTPFQKAAMLADLNSNSRNFLDNTYVPVATSITTPNDLLISPANGITAQFYNAVSLEWKSVAGASHYMVEIDIVPSFVTGLIKTYITTNTSILITDLDPNDTYYWRVKPFNYSVGCAEAKARNFKVTATATNTVEIEGLSAWQVSPNPVAGDRASIIAKASHNFEVNAHIVDAAGQIVRTIAAVQFSEGSNTVELPLDGLSNGFYFIILDNGKARDMRKLVLAR